MHRFAASIKSDETCRCAAAPLLRPSSSRNKQCHRGGPLALSASAEVQYSKSNPGAQLKY